MSESVDDKITVPLVYEGRAAKILQNEEEVKRIEKFYTQCQIDGASKNAIEKSKRATTNLNIILGDKDELKISKDFINHYEKVIEGSTVAEKAMFVCSNREMLTHFTEKLLN